MAPLQVIQTLSTNAVATMGMIKKYLSDTIERERREIANNRNLITSYRDATATKRQELVDLATKPTVFQSRRCGSCGGSLDLPTVHFLCKHSFHQRCLNVPANAGSLPSMYEAGRASEGGLEGVECPVCEKQNSTLKAIRRAQVEAAGRHDLFTDVLGRSRDGLGTVAEFFGRGVMGVGGE